MDREAVEDAERVPHGGSDDSNVIDFSANTNPIAPEGITSVYRSALGRSRSYPPEPPTVFCDAAAEYVECDAGDVIPTAGGLAAIRLAIELAAQSNDSVLLPAPSFGEYEREVRLQGATPTFVDQGSIVTEDPTDYELAIVCNPNNPTGNGYDEKELRSFADQCREAGTTLLVDEAFLDFTDHSSLAGTEGTIVARSLTKMFGLPGLRSGFAVATGKLGERLSTVRRPWNVGTPALEVGAFCLRQTAFVEATQIRVRKERNRMRESLVDRFDVHPSDAPFLLLDVGESSIDAILTAARDGGLAIRDATTFRELDAHVRVAVRLPDENDLLLKVLHDV